MPLRGHRRLVALNIQTQPSLAGDIIGQINWKTESVIKLEDHVARDTLVGNLLQGLLENGHTVVECPSKLLFFALQGRRDRRLLGDELRIRLSHLGHQLWHQLGKKGLLGAQLVAVSNRATDDAPQYIPPPLIARHDTICNQERR